MQTIERLCTSLHTPMILRSSSYDPIVLKRIWKGFKAKEERTYNRGTRLMHENYKMRKYSKYYKLLCDKYTRYHSLFLSLKMISIKQSDSGI